MLFYCDKALPKATRAAASPKDLSRGLTISTAAITAMLMASGKAWNSLNIDTSLREYTTKSPSTAAGKTLPRYFI